ncbi:carbohydrate sulfotransferase 9-like [Chelydra serpentina]|uniref:Carbohydrate sulfotransferase n=1 Tax=Chelydra serpentina TaxID=8475 RepID=A0A8T1SKE6_CHESE|nr:carbohydrate sulfotransferase 9-like [Chelydra serpentina]
MLGPCLLFAIVVSSWWGSSEMPKTRFLLHLLSLALLCCLSLLWWGHLLRSHPPQRKGDLEAEMKDDLPLTFDTLLHVQQLRKKTLRSFCSKTAKVTKLPASQQQAAEVLSRIALSTKLAFLYCRVPAIGLESWERLLEVLEEKADVTLEVPVHQPQQHGLQKRLSEYNLTAMEAIRRSYTKVLFVRDPFQRLISAYMQGLADGLTFKEFIQSILNRGPQNASLEWTPLVSLCRPCLIQYDYVMMFGFLKREVHHLMHRMGLPVDVHLPEFTDSQIRSTYSWLSEQLFSELSLKERRQLAHFYHWDLAAFRFSSSLLWDLPSTEGSR